MTELRVDITEETIKAVEALQQRVGTDDVYLYLWVFLEQWCTRDIHLFEVNTPIFMQLYEENTDQLGFGAYAHNLMEEVLGEIQDE